MTDIMEFFRNLRRPAGQSDELVAVELRADGIAIAAAQGRGMNASLSFCDFLPRLKSSRKQTELSTLVDAAGLSGTHTSLVLSPGQYRMGLIKAPVVPPEELREAVRAKIADKIDFPVEDAVLDVFLMPEDGLRGGPQTAFLVVANRRIVQPLLDALCEAELEPVHIDIRELALRNLIERYCEPPRAGALLSLRSGDAGDLTIVREGNLYLHRSVDFTLESLGQDPVTRDAALAELVVEVRRSLDYFEVQLAQAAVSRLAVTPIPDHMDVLMGRLSAALSAEVFPLKVDVLARSERQLSSIKNQQCVAAVGAALRSTEAPLRQQVDLFATGFVEPRVVLPLSQAVSILALIAVCMGLWHALVGYQSLQAGRLAEQVVLPETRLAPTSAPRTSAENAQLRAALDRARAQLNGRQRLLQTVREQKKAPRQALTAYLRGLANQPHDGIWLTHIRLQEAGRVISLRGRTVAPGNVPRLLLELQSAKAFRGVQFDDLSMHLYEGRSLEPLQFELRSRPGEDA